MDIIKKNNQTLIWLAIVVILIFMIVSVNAAKSREINKLKGTLNQRQNENSIVQGRLNKMMDSYQSHKQAVDKLDATIKELKLENQSLLIELDGFTKVKEKLANELIIKNDLEEKIAQLEKRVMDLTEQLKQSKAQIFSLERK
ncbi:MAG: hypothetical protein ABH952_06540 [Candidatus Omnitrophota bacterium]